MSDETPTEPGHEAQVVGYTGIYDADGGPIGEARYLIAHLLGTAHCALCDITHSPIRRKPEWDLMVARIGVPFRLLHRNQLDGQLAEVVDDATLPVVLAEHADGGFTQALSSVQLAELEGSVSRFEKTLLP